MKHPFQKYIFASLLFGSNGIFASMVSLGSYEIVLLRSLLGLLCMAFIFVIGKNKLTFPRYKKSFALLCLSGIAMGISWMSLYEAYRRIGVSISTLCLYFGPAIVMAASPFLFKEKMTRRKSVSFLIVLLGMVLVNGQLAMDGNDLSGIFFGLLAAVGYALDVSCNKYAKDIGGLENAMIHIFFALAVTVLFVGVTKGFSMHILPSDIPPILMLGLVNTGIGCYFALAAINILPVQTVAICGYLEPLSAVVLSVLFLHETMLPLQIVGGALILGGAIFAELQKKAPAEPTQMQ